MRNNQQTYFLTFVTAERQPFFRHERWCNLLLSVLQNYRAEYALHDFIFMPDHVHFLATPEGPLERLAQLIKGNSSFRAKRELKWTGKIWQAGYSDHRIRDLDDAEQHALYIHRNLMSTSSACTHRFNGESSGIPLDPLPQWLKPHGDLEDDGLAEARPFQRKSITAQSNSTEVPPIQSSPSEVLSAMAEASSFQRESIKSQSKSTEVPPLQNFSICQSEMSGGAEEC